MATETLTLIHNVLDTEYEAFSEEVLRDAKRQVIDLVATMVSSAGGPGNHALFDLVREWGGAPRAIILVHGDQLPLTPCGHDEQPSGRSYDFECTGPDAFLITPLIRHKKYLSCQGNHNIIDCGKWQGICGRVQSSTEQGGQFPLIEEELTEKYWHNFDFCGKILRSNAEKVLDMINHL